MNQIMTTSELFVALLVALLIRDIFWLIVGGVLNGYDDEDGNDTDITS